MQLSSTVRVLFDESLNEQGHIDLNYQKLRQTLDSNNFKVDRTSSKPITPQILQKCDIFVIACPTNAQLESNEIAAILNFLETGGSLLVLSGNGGDKKLYTNLNQLCAYFGVEFNNDQVIDETQHVVFNSVLRLTDLKPHDVFEGINEIHYPSGCSLQIKDYPMVLVQSSNGAEPPNTPLIVASHYKNKGKVLISGSYRIFRDKVLGGMESAQNLQLALNLFNYLAQEVVKPAWEEGLASTQLTAMKQDKVLGESALPTVSPSQLSTVSEHSSGPKTGSSITTRIGTNKGVVTLESLQDSINSLQIDLRELKSFVQNGFFLLRNSIEHLTAKPIGAVKREKSALVQPQVPVLKGNVEEAIREAKIEHKSLLELLDYITQRYQVGALNQADFSHQRDRLTKEIQTLEERIKSLESRK